MAIPVAVTAVWTSPLREVERAAQERAKAAELDMSTPGAGEQLRTVLIEEVGLWRDEYRKGRRPVDIADPEAAVDRAYRNLSGYGPLEPLLVDSDVWEIMINGPSSIFTKRHSGTGGYHDEVFHDDEHVIRVLTKILDDAGRSHRKLDPAEGLQDAQLDSGSRLHIVHSDVGRDGHVLVTSESSPGCSTAISKSFWNGECSSQVTARFLQACVRTRAIDPGCGRTRLGQDHAPRMSSGRVGPEPPGGDRGGGFRDRHSPSQRGPYADPSGPADRREVDLRRLVAGFLRMAPDVAIVGEVRDREAMPLLLLSRRAFRGSPPSMPGRPVRRCPASGSYVSWRRRGPS